MEKRPLPRRPAPSAGPGSNSPDAQTRLGRGDTALPGEEHRWSELGATRVLADVPSPSSDLPADDASLPSAERADKDIGVIGEFRILKRLGEGAMGAVYKAFQMSFQREVALKVLFKHIGNNDKLVKRLEREGQLMGLLDHPNIVRAYAVDYKDDWHYVAMEFVDGESLQKWLGRLGRLPVADAVQIALTCAQALAHAHEQGVIHRDIKPDNILISRQGEIKVADFGMVKTLDEDMSLTQTGHAVGTPWYMPLEQARNAKETNARSDIYALGCMLYCCLTGHPPFPGPTLVEVIKAKEVGTFPTARSVNPDVPERLDLIIAKMTAKLPKYRYASCAELIADLESLGLAGEELTFLNASFSGKASAADRPIVATMVGEMSAAAKTTDEWYLRYENSQGQTLVRRLNTGQILRLLEEKAFDATATASRKPTEGFRALATFKEFETAALGRVSKEAVDEKTVRFRNLYKKIEAQELARDKKPKERHVTNIGYWGGIFLRVAAGFAVVGFIGFLLWYFANGLGK